MALINLRNAALLRWVGNPCERTRLAYQRACEDVVVADAAMLAKAFAPR